MVFEGYLKVQSVQYVEQMALDGWESHRGFPHLCGLGIAQHSHTLENVGKAPIRLPRDQLKGPASHRGGFHHPEARGGSGKGARRKARQGT